MCQQRRRRNTAKRLAGYAKWRVPVFFLPILLLLLTISSASRLLAIGTDRVDSGGRRLSANGSVVPDEVYYDLPHYRQQDPAWGDEIMYPFDGSIELYGCAVTSLAMTVWHFGEDFDPSQMNQELGLYAAPLEWEAYTAAHGLTIKRKESTLDARVQLLDRLYVKHEVIRELALGNPVILGIQHNEHNTTHFVVANGYSYIDGTYTVHILDPSTNNDYQTIDDIDPAWEYMRLLVIEA